MVMRRTADAAVMVSTVFIIGCGGNNPGARPPQSPPRHKHPTALAPTSANPKADWYAQHHWMRRAPCGDGCQFVTHNHSEIRLLLRADGSAEGADHGEALEELNTAVGDNGRITRWRRQWRGGWSEQDGRISINLKPHGLNCNRLTHDGSIDHPCKPLALNLVCEHAQIQISRPQPKLASGWVCIPEQRTRSDDLTPLPWVFGDSEWFVALERGNRKHRRGPRRRYAIGDVTTYPKSPP